MQRVPGCGFRLARGSSLSANASPDPQPATRNGNAQDAHFAPLIFGNSRQHAAQHEAVRARHGSSFPHPTHHDGRTIRSASRPTNDNALASVRTRTFYEESSL